MKRSGKMLVKYWMRPPLTILDVDDSVESVAIRVKEYCAPHLPVTKDGRLVGVVREVDILRAIPADRVAVDPGGPTGETAVRTVGMITAEYPVTVSPDFTLEETAALLLLAKTNEAPVVDSSGRILGFISQQDVLWAMMTLNGFEGRGVQFALEVRDRPGAVKELLDIVRSQGGRLASLLTSYARASCGSMKVYLKVYGIDSQLIPLLKHELSAKASLLYLIDHRENKREECASATPRTEEVPRGE
jgi:acetoin utilization protein AcuB